MTNEEYLALQTEYMALVKAETYNERREELRLSLDERYTLWWESLTPEEQEDARAKAREAIRDYHRRRKAGLV